MVMEIVDYLYKSFPEKHKFLKKSNIPMVMVLSKLALENNISPENFKKFVDYFSGDISEEYMADKEQIEEIERACSEYDKEHNEIV